MEIVNEHMILSFIVGVLTCYYLLKYFDRLK